MGFLDRLKGELVDIIEFLDDSNDTLVYRFERYGNEIKNGARLTVREGQAAVFISEGQLADVFFPGMYTLTTQNLPLLSTLKGWRYGFESPFKAEVYFVSTRRFTDQKWGTKNPIMLRDPEFGPIRLRAFGNYTFRVEDPAVFIKEIVGTDGHFTTQEINDQLRNVIVARFTDKLGESKIPALDLAANYDELGELLQKRIEPEMKEYGLVVPKFLIENISLPPAVEEALDKRTSMGMVGNLDNYMKYQAANAMEASAENPGGSGAAGDAMGMGMGFAMANQMAHNFQPGPQGGGQAAPAQQAAPPPAPREPRFHLAENGQTQGPFSLSQLRQMQANHQFFTHSYVWQPGFDGWKKASDVPELFPIFQTPPPPPGGTPPAPPPM